MSKRELTKAVNELSVRVRQLERDNQFLYNEVMKLRMFSGDLQAVQAVVKDIQNTQCRKAR